MQNPGRMSRELLVFSALLPVLWAVVQYVRGSEPAAVSAPPERPALVFHTHLVNLGTAPAMPVVGAKFRFTNRGKQTVRIVEAKPSCGCLTPRLAKRQYAPGESGVLILPVQTPNQSPGPHTYYVTLRYTDPHPRETVLMFKVVLPEKQVTVSPPALAVYQLSGKQETTRTLHVFDYPRTGLKLTGVRCDSPLASVQLGHRTIDEAGHPQHDVLVTVRAKVPPGRHRGVISITTNHPRYRVIKVPLMIVGPPAAQQSPEKSLQ